VNVAWGLVFPVFVSAITIGAYLALRLKFFSSTARGIDEILSEVREFDIDSFQKLVSGAADEYLASCYLHLNFRQRQEAAYNRFKVTRQGLDVIIWNAVLFEEVGRFHSRRIVGLDPKKFSAEDELVLQTFDRAIVCHLLAAVAFAKLLVLEACHVAWPWYIPDFCGLGGTGRQSLLTSYEHLISSILEFARLDRRDWVYDNLLFALTGLIECGDNSVADES
jgi:hypothetical protein